MNRDPLHDPRPGDWLTNGKIDLRIDRVELVGGGVGTVYFARFKSRRENAHALVRLTLAEFRQLAIKQSARVLARAKEP